MKFDEAFDVLIGNEGEFTRDPRDRGNWTSGKIDNGELKGTKFGISAMTYPLVDIKNLTLDKAKAIYKRDFWNKMNADKLPKAILFDLFDMAVNSGVSTACRTLQRAVGSTPDGVIGPKTVANIALMDEQLVDKRFAAQRLLFLCDMATWPSFGKGWVRRVANNLMSD